MITKLSEKTIWQASNFQSPNDDIGYMDELTVGYCEARAHYYQHRAFNSDYPIEDYHHSFDVENARHWYIMAEQARVLGGTIPYLFYSSLREFIQSEQYHSPYNRITRNDLLPNQKNALIYYDPKTDKPTSPNLPGATYATPYGEVRILCNAKGEIEIRASEPVTIYSVNYRINITYVEKGNSTYFQNFSRRVGENIYATSAASKHMEETIMPFVKVFKATHPDCAAEAQRQQYAYDMACARAEIVSAIEKLRATSKYLDIIEGELEQGYLNPQDSERLKKLRHINISPRG